MRKNLQEYEITYILDRGSTSFQLAVEFQQAMLVTQTDQVQAAHLKVERFEDSLTDFTLSIYGHRILGRYDWSEVDENRLEIVGRYRFMPIDFEGKILPPILEWTFNLDGHTSMPGPLNCMFKKNGYEVSNQKTHLYAIAKAFLATLPEWSEQRAAEQTATASK